MPERTRRLVLFVFGLSGFVSIALEVVWFRVLVLYVESDTYAFTIMLASVLTGIAIGGYLAAAVLHRWGARLAHLAVIELAVSVSTLASFAFLSKSFTVNGRYGERSACSARSALRHRRRRADGDAHGNAAGSGVPDRARTVDRRR